MRSRWLYMLPALLLSALAVVLALFGLSRPPAVEAGSAPGVVMQVETSSENFKHLYWVAAQEMNLGSTIKAGDFLEVGVSVPLAEAVKTDMPVTGKLLRRNIREGEILAHSHLEASNRLAQVVPAGFRAFAVAVDNTSAVGGLLQPGDLVDVLVHFRKGRDGQPTTMILLNGIEVLAVHGRLQEQEQADRDQQQGRNHRNNTVVLAVPREDMPLLLLADTEGEVRLAMAGQARQQTAEQATEEQTATLHLVTDFETLFPRKKQAPQRAQGERVEVYEGSTSRSTYVH